MCLRRYHEGTKARRHEGTKARRHEGTKTRKGDSTRTGLRSRPVFRHHEPVDEQTVSPGVCSSAGSRCLRRRFAASASNRLLLRVFVWFVFLWFRVFVFSWLHLICVCI